MQEPDEVVPNQVVVEREVPTIVATLAVTDERLEGMRVLLSSPSGVPRTIIDFSFGFMSAYLQGRLQSGGSSL